MGKERQSPWSEEARGCRVVVGRRRNPRPPFIDWHANFCMAACMSLVIAHHAVAYVYIQYISARWGAT